MGQAVQGGQRESPGHGERVAHDLKLCLAQWLASEKRHEPRVLREQLGPLFEHYPGLR